MMFGLCVQLRAGAGGQPVTPLRPQDTDDAFFGRRGHPDGFAYGRVYAQAGMSLAYDEDQARMVFGAPGAWDWSGTVVVADRNGARPIMAQPWSESEPIRYLSIILSQVTPTHTLSKGFFILKNGSPVLLRHLCFFSIFLFNT